MYSEGSNPSRWTNIHRYPNWYRGSAQTRLFVCQFDSDPMDYTFILALSDSGSVHQVLSLDTRVRASEGLLLSRGAIGSTQDFES